jgi:hypothetical protein
VCDIENLKNEKAMTGVGSQGHRKERKTFYIELYEHAILDYLRAVIFGATADKLDFTRARCLHKNST